MLKDLCTKTFLYVLIVMCGSYSFGCVISYPSATIEFIKDEFGPFTTFEIASFQSIPAIVAIFAPFLYNFALQKTKIKYVSSFLGIFGCVTYLMLLVLNRKLFWLAVFIRGLHGIILAGSALVCPLYINMLAPEGKKGFFGPFHVFSINFAHITTNLIGVAHNWRYPIYSAAAILFLHGSLVWIIPDSPGEVKNKTAAEKDKKARNEKNKIFEKKNIRPLMISIMLMSLTQFSGIGAINQNAAPILKEVGLNIDSGFQAAIAVSAQIFAIFTGSLLLDRLGPRLLWIISSSGTVLSLLVYALNVKFQWHSIIPMIALFTFQMFFGLGLSPIPTTISPTLFTPDVKSLGMTIATSANRLVGAIMMFIFPYMRVWMGQFGLMLCLSIFNLLCLIFGAVFLQSKIESAKDIKDEIQAEDIDSAENASIQQQLLNEDHIEGDVRVPGDSEDVNVQVNADV